MFSLAETPQAGAWETSCVQNFTQNASRLGGKLLKDTNAPKLLAGDPTPVAFQGICMMHIISISEI